MQFCELTSSLFDLNFINFFPKGQIIYKPSLVHQAGDKPFSEPMVYWRIYASLDLDVLTYFKAYSHIIVKRWSFSNKETIGLMTFSPLLNFLVQFSSLCQAQWAKLKCTHHVASDTLVTLVQVIACQMSGAKPLTEQMMGYCQLDP